MNGAQQHNILRDASHHGMTKLTTLISFHNNRPSCFTCSANWTDLCFIQFPSLSNTAPSKAGLAIFFLVDEVMAEVEAADEEGILLLLEAAELLLV